MARMIPQQISRNIKSPAEEKLFQIFSKNLDDTYVIFHSAWWQNAKYVIQDREADFIIVHPQKGILILEAKAGEIRYDPFNKKWLQNSKELKISPFQQAKDIKFHFLGLLSKFPKFARKDFVIGQCVAFTDIDFFENGLPSEAPQEILLLRSHLNSNIQGSINKIFKYYEANSPKAALGQDRVQQIIDLISPSTKFRKCMVNDLGEVIESLYELTENQYDVLDNLCLQKKCIILGCAGSGKTQLAIEKSRRLSQHKNKTLLTCRSEPLSKYILLSLEKETQEEYCDVISFDELTSITRSSNLLYDAIIVDEGQDFSSQDIYFLNSFLKDNGLLYIFQDSNQNVYNKINSSSIEINPIVLSKNCRNTKKIFEYVRPLVNCSHPLQSSNIEGLDVIERRFKSSSELIGLLSADLNELINNQKLSPSEITIVTNLNPPDKSFLNRISHIAAFKIKPLKCHQKNKEEICWSTATDYKGLENKVIIFIGEKQKTFVPTPWDISNKYVGLTRANALLIVYEQPDLEINF